MSLYNALFGHSPFAGLLLQALNLSPDAIPRFRDCYMTDAGEICVYTRTGGGNRPYYESAESRRDEVGECDSMDGPWNADLRAVEGFIRDEDDDFDSTYASFFYRVPEAFKSIIETLKGLGAEGPPPSERFKAVIQELQNGERSPQTDRALQVGAQLFSAIEAKLNGGDA